MPDVVGMKKEDAIKALKKRNLGYRIISADTSEQYDKGVIIEQKTEAVKAKVAKNTEDPIGRKSRKRSENSIGTGCDGEERG